MCLLETLEESLFLGLFQLLEATYVPRLTALPHHLVSLTLSILPAPAASKALVTTSLPAKFRIIFLF